MNLNKLFPRLTIRAKLTIAFALLAGFPVMAVSAFAIHDKGEQLRRTSARSLDRDLRAARTRLERVLEESGENVSVLASANLAPVLSDPRPERIAQAERRLARLIRYTPSLHRVELINADGEVVLAQMIDSTRRAERARRSADVYYHRFAKLAAGNQVVLVTGSPAAADSVLPLNVIAVISAVRDTAGNLLGALAGELYAPELFAESAVTSPTSAAVTGLLDEDGHDLYDAGRKVPEFSPSRVAHMLAHKSGTLHANQQLVRFARLEPAGFGSTALVLYRAIPLSALAAPVRRFTILIVLANVLLGLIVLGLAVTAANEFTRPIYRLRDAMRRLAAGATSSDLQIDTNDELEELAREFVQMSTTLTAYRSKLEELVTERTRALVEAYGELENILAHSADAIIGLDPAERVRIWNRGAEQLFGYSAADALGHPIDVLIRPDRGSATQEQLYLHRSLHKGEAVVDFRTERVHKDGYVVPVSLTQSVVRDEHGECLGYSLILRDARRQARLEAQMRRSERLAAASVTAAALAHEVNNPLAIIANRIECVQREVGVACPTCQFTADLSLLREQTERLNVVTRDMLSLTHGEMESVGLVDANAIATRLTRLIEPSFTARDIRLRVHLTTPLTEFEGHEQAFETVVLNLLLNAADATPSGGEVCLETRMARFGTEVELEVSDTGCGIAEDLRERIFEPFFTTKGQRGGTGLGLAVCQAVIDQHGGRITLNSEVGIGSSFCVAVPVNALIPL